MILHNTDQGVYALKDEEYYHVNDMQWDVCVIRRGVAPSPSLIKLKSAVKALIEDLAPAAMHHGGPFPATTSSGHTSIGAASILRFARPLCYQNFPDDALPAQLQNKNSRNIWRLLNNEVTQADV